MLNRVPNKTSSGRTKYTRIENIRVIETNCTSRSLLDLAWSGPIGLYRFKRHSLLCLYDRSPQTVVLHCQAQMKTYVVTQVRGTPSGKASHASKNASKNAQQERYMTISLHGPRPPVWHPPVFQQRSLCHDEHLLLFGRTRP